MQTKKMEQSENYGSWKERRGKRGAAHKTGGRRLRRRGVNELVESRQRTSCFHCRLSFLLSLPLSSSLSCFNTTAASDSWSFKTGQKPVSGQVTISSCYVGLIPVVALMSSWISTGGLWQTAGRTAVWRLGLNQQLGRNQGTISLSRLSLTLLSLLLNCGYFNIILYKLLPFLSSASLWISFISFLQQCWFSSDSFCLWL